MSDLSLQLVDKDLKKVEQKILSEQPKRKRSGKSNLVIETAVFLDKAAYDVYFKWVVDYLSNPDSRVFFLHLCEKQTLI